MNMNIIMHKCEYHYVNCDTLIYEFEIIYAYMNVLYGFTSMKYPFELATWNYQRHPETLSVNF